MTIVGLLANECRRCVISGNLYYFGIDYGPDEIRNGAFMKCPQIIQQ